MTDLILHHYDFSNYSEKARVAMGFKSLPWKSVIVPPVLPKPDLTPLTGGYSTCTAPSKYSCMCLTSLPPTRY
jgi:hypothetical protein